MKKILSIILLGFFYKILILEPSVVEANTFRLNSISVEGNNRISDAAVVNYSRLVPQNNLSAEDLNNAYSRIVKLAFSKALALNGLIET